MLNKVLEVIDSIESLKNAALIVATILVVGASSHATGVLLICGIGIGLRHLILKLRKK